MAFLINKLKMVAMEMAKVVAKRHIFGKSPRLLQFENDINRLFLYTSYNMVGNDGNEDVEEIIQMGNQFSLKDQHSQVQQNVHSQIKAFCFSINQLLHPNSPSETGVTCHHGIGLGSSVGQITPPNGNLMTKMELSQALKARTGFTLELKQSAIRHKEVGQGIFISGEAGIGTVVAIYPGVVYSPSDYRYIPGYPKIGSGNPFLITRYDGTVINAQPWGIGGDAPEAWAGQTHPLGGGVGCNSGGVETRSDRIWKFMSAPIQAGRKDGADILVERRNPLAMAHMVNHPPKGVIPNVVVCPYDFPLGEATELRRHIPNVVLCEGGGVEMKRFGAFWLRSLGGGDGARVAPTRVLKTVVLVTSRAVVDEEVLLDYRLSNSRHVPEWYVPVDEDAQRRRWG